MGLETKLAASQTTDYSWNYSHSQYCRLFQNYSGIIGSGLILWDQQIDIFILVTPDNEGFTTLVASEGPTGPLGLTA